MLVPNPRFDMGLVNTGRMSQKQPDWPEDMVKKIFAPPGPLKKLAAQYITCPTMDNNDEWYTWDETKGEEYAQGSTLQEGPALALAVLSAEGGQRGTAEEMAEGIRGSDRDVNLDADVPA